MASTKQNTPGLGIEYEVHLPAYFALLLNTNPEIEDFKLQSNVEEFGNLDDLLVDIKTRGGENLYFAFQLKHKERSSKNLLPTNFEARGDFNLEKYCEAFKNLNEENRKKYHFILYTNKNFDSSRTNEVKKFDMKQDDSCLGRNFFDTSGDGKHLYKFEVNEETEDGKNVSKDDFREFFSQFSLYTGQANIRDLDKSHILDILKCRECYVTYIDFFRRWHRGDFVDKSLDKKTLNVHLVDILLSSVVINCHLSDGQDGNLIFFEEMIQQFNITIIDASKQEFIKQLKEKVYKYPEEFNNQEDMIRLAKDHKFIDRFTKELKEETKLKLLHYFYQKPLILDFQSSEDVIYESSKLCRIQENEIKLVILGQDIDASKFSHLKIFTNLTGVDGNFLEETKRICKLSLQGRNISFEEIFEDGILEFVTPREIFQMLKGNFSIGEDKENLPECYIPRTVSATVFDIETIIKHSSRTTAIIFYYEDKFEELKILLQNIVDGEDYLYEDFLDGVILKKKEPSKKQLQEDNSKDTLPEIATILLKREECSRKQLDAIREKIGKVYVHSFKVIDEKRCLLLKSTNKISYNKQYKYTKISVDENNMHGFFNNSINIVCAQPGMGKSTLMKYLRNECDPNFWTVRVDLKAHNHFLKRDHKIEDVLNYFLELENCQDMFLLNTKKVFLEKRKIVLFLDGLDEVGNECVDTVLNITRELSEMGFRIWLSSRQNLQQKLEQYFNIFTIEINQVNEDQQKEYIENRLMSLYDKTQIEEIVKTIFSNTNLANNRQILEIPLQLHIITQIFLDDKYYYSNLSENNFILTKMLEIFFEGKFTHYLDKVESKHNHFLRTLLEEKLENYEIVALHSVLDDEHFQKLQIEKLTVTRIKNSDFLGIITEINGENKAVFEHLTYAEYFASKFLVKNFDKARILKEEIFAQKYQNLLLIFNIMLAEDSPLHLAVIYKDLSRIEEMEQSSLVDKGGRDFLQVAACMATRHPPLESVPEPITSECLVKDIPIQHFKGEDSKMKEIINLVLLSEPFKNDKIFEWNSLDYALAAGALYVVEAILEKSEKPSNFCEMLGKYYSDEVVAYYSIRFGYHRLLSEILAKKSCHVIGIHSDYLWWKANSSILHFLFTLDCAIRIRIVELLTSDDINKIVYDKTGYSFLHFSVLHEDTEFIKFLLQKGADVNVKDNDGWTPLVLVIKQDNFDLSKLLIEKGADVNIKDKTGWSSLFWAVERDNLEIAKLLVEKGADVNIKDKEDWSPLLWAANRSNFEILKFLVEKGADFNIKDKDGKSALIWAIMRRNLQISKLLIEIGADIDGVKEKGDLSPLYWATKQSSLEIFKLLIEKGADINIKDIYGRSLLVWAVKRNNLEISKLLVEKGADVNIRDEDGWSPLFFAVKQNDLEMSKWLIEKGADVNIKNEDGNLPLFLAIERDNLDISTLLIENGIDINIKNGDGLSPLFWAVNQNNLAISKFLIEKGADIHIKDEDGYSPLFRAVKQNNLEISRLLIENGADVNIKLKDGWSLLLYAINESNLEISNLLIEKGADVNIKLKDGWSPLLYAISKSNLEISNLLIEKGADVNIKLKDGWSPLLYAISKSNLEISKLLIENGADLNFKTQDGWSPLFLAISGNRFEISDLLFEKGADVNIKNKDDWSPLMYSIDQGNLNISKLLLEKGADVNIQDEGGWSPLLLAIKRNNLEISKLLIEKDADVNIKEEGHLSPLMYSVNQGNLEISKLLIEKGADVNIKVKDGSLLLFYALNRSKLEVLKLLLEKGADVNSKDRHGWSPLFCAINQNDLDIAKMLIEEGADVNAKNEYGLSPLLWTLSKNDHVVERESDVNFKDKGIHSANQSNLEITKLLIDKGADVNIADKDGKTPLFWAVERNNFEISKMLLERGAEVNSEATKNKISLSFEITSTQLLFNKETETKKISPLLRLAIKRGNFNLVQILIDKGASWNEETFFDAVYCGNIQIIELFLTRGVDLSKLNSLQKAIIRNNAFVVKYLIENGVDANL